MKREYFFIPGVVDEKKMKEEATAAVVKGDTSLIHYHGVSQTCNQQCHQVELPKEDKGDVL